MNCHVKKSVSYIIVASELKMSFLYNNLCTLYIHMWLTMFVTCNYNVTHCKCVIKNNYVATSVQCTYVRSCQVCTFPPPTMGYNCN
jgi:hypothetical protein